MAMAMATDKSIKQIQITIIIRVARAMVSLYFDTRFDIYTYEVNTIVQHAVDIFAIDIVLFVLYPSLSVFVRSHKSNNIGSIDVGIVCERTND